MKIIKPLLLAVSLLVSVAVPQTTPTTWDGWSRLADVQVLKNDNEGAINSATECIKLTPAASSCYATRGSTNAALGRASAAIVDLKKAVELGHPSPLVYQMLAESAINTKANDLAIATMTKSIAQFSSRLAGAELAEHYFIRAVANINSGKHADGIADVTAALKVGGLAFRKNYKGHPYTVRATVYCAKGEFDLAVYDEKKAKEFGAKSAKPCDATESALASGRVIDFEVSGKRMGSSLHIMNGLAAIVDGNVTKAIADFTKAIEMYPRSAEAYYQRAVVYDRTGQKQSATADIEQALKLNPNHEEAVELKQRLEPTTATAQTTSPTSSSHEVVLFFDGFDDNRHNWPLGKNDYAEGFIANGRQTITIRTDVYHKTMLAATVAPQIDQTKDFMIETSITLVSGSENYPFGINWGMKDLHANSFEFGINAVGRFHLSKIANGQWQAIVPWTANSAVKAGAGATNKLAIRKRASQLELYINDTLVSTTNYETYTSPASIGYNIGFKKIIEIDYLKVIQFK